MTSGPVVIQVLEGENAVAHHREVMGATDLAKSRRRHRPQAVRSVHWRELGPRFGLGSLGRA